MTYANVKKHYARDCLLADGEFNARTFDTIVKAKNPGDEAGTMIQGKLSTARIDLIKSDARRRKLDTEKKFPELIVKEPEPVDEEPAEKISKKSKRGK